MDGILLLNGLQHTNLPLPPFSPCKPGQSLFLLQNHFNCICRTFICTDAATLAIIVIVLKKAVFPGFDRHVRAYDLADPAFGTLFININRTEVSPAPGFVFKGRARFTDSAACDFKLFFS